MDSAYYHRAGVEEVHVITPSTIQTDSSARTPFVLWVQVSATRLISMTPGRKPSKFCNRGLQGQIAMSAVLSVAAKVAFSGFHQGNRLGNGDRLVLFTGLKRGVYCELPCPLPTRCFAFRIP